MQHFQYHLVLIATAAVLLVGCEQPQPAVVPSGKSIKVGIIAPFSGSESAKGEEGMRGIQTMLRMQPLLANGDRIELITKDDQNDPVKAVEALQELVRGEAVAAIVTFSNSGPALAMAMVADLFNTPILAALATHPDITENNGYVSQVCFDNNFQGNVAALFVRDELLVDSVAIFHNPGNFYSSNLATVFGHKFNALKGSVTDEIALPEGSTDVTAILEGIQDKGTELLYLPIAAKDVITIVQAIAQMAWKPILMTSDGLLATVVSTYKPQLKLLDGLLTTDFYHHDSLGTPFADRVSEVRSGPKGTSYTALGVETFAILLAAMNRCNDPTDKACINRQVRSTTHFEGLLGKISIDASGKAHRPLVINAIKGQKLKHIVKVY